jgi:hypothetical protein
MNPPPGTRRATTSLGMKRRPSGRLFRPNLDALFVLICHLIMTGPGGVAGESFVNVAGYRTRQGIVSHENTHNPGSRYRSTAVLAKLMACHPKSYCLIKITKNSINFITTI